MVSIQKCVRSCGGVYNETYLQIVTDLAREAASYGIYILADMHQDGLSERFCGEGVPLWAVPKDASFPLPLGLPYRGQGKDGLPTRSECKRHTWYEYQSAYSSGAAYERLYTNQEEAVDGSMSSEEPMELRLSGKDISNRCNLATQERQEPVQLQRLQAGKSRAVYDFVPARSYVLKLSMEHGHGREVEAAASLPGITPATEAFDKILMRLYWRKENTEYLLLTEVLKQAKVTPLNQAWPNVIPETVVIQAGIIIAFAAKLWQVRDLGSYNLAAMDASARGYKLCILDMADWVPWGQRCPVFPGKQKARGLLTFVRHGHSEGLLRLFESFAGQNPDNLTNSWGAYWAKVLQSFQGFEGLLGVNLINEPFVGNPYTDPGLMVPEAADRLRLQPAYDVVARHIRAADPDAIIFFPGTTSDRTGRPYTDFLPQGFQHAPGGKEFADRAVNSFHFYAPPQSLDYVKKYFTKRIQDARQLGTGLFLTESCCETFFQNVAPVVESLGMSWIHWEWKQFFRETNATRKSEDQNAAFGADKTGCGGWPYNNGVLNMTMLRYLARPYAQAIAGNFTSSSFDPSSGDFGLIFKADPKIRAPTVISVPELTYPDGVEVLVSPEGAGKFKLDQSLVQLTNNASLAHGEELTIQVKAKRTSLVV
ncbi:Endoglycoceramidase [Symbiodinium microadriaticum]|uniref:Endoglycoceramidase n=2 Tax=Symbiodinium microadriaticum TaxID=2951 RepID=A0A1Q9C775_SYMMI|nr:Endoglycoceramidase [Symbiodinium microadriaticum]